MATAQNLTEINEVIRKLEKTVRVFSDRDRKQLLTKAAAPARKELRISTKVSSRAREKVNIVGQRSYRVGNLRRSMKTLTKLKRSASVFVGPDFGRNAKEGADGYYFAMAYGTVDGRKRKNAVSNYRRELLIPSAQRSEKATINEFRKDFARRFGTRAAQQRLDVG
jgi:hypothetical protein